MRKARTVLKFATAGAVTTLYAAATVAAFKPEIKAAGVVSPGKVATVAGALTAATWIATLA